MIREDDQIIVHSAWPEPAPVGSIGTSTVHYSEILSRFGLDFGRVGNYLEVGVIDWTQGWILDMGVICTQIDAFLERVLPFLIGQEVPFRVVRNREIARSMLGGEFGYTELGKLMSIFPRNDDDALALANQLIRQTRGFSEPKILTDHYLGGVVYARYGACKPVVLINQQNVEELYIYDSQGKLVKEPLAIPFSLPDGVNWPFASITHHQAVKQETVLQDKYRPMQVLKSDAKGSVRKGLMLAKWLWVKWCVIKEGKKNMISDDWGRDISDRLKWQFDLHRQLEGFAPLPKVYDFFQENDDSYLVMEYISGASLFNVVTSIVNSKSWLDLQLTERESLLDYAMQIIDIIKNMHGRGFIHRDIMPNNFLVDRRRRLWLIDLELSYSERLRRPSPPFRLGTHGFMSPEQQEGIEPTQSQDVYAIGAMLIFLLTGLFPNGFSLQNVSLLSDQVAFHIEDRLFVNDIVSCLSIDATFRPSLLNLKTCLQEFRIRQQPLEKKKSETGFHRIDRDQLKFVLENALHALSTPLFISMDNVWFSKRNENEAFAYEQSESVAEYNGYAEGCSGIIYLLAKACRAGFPIKACAKGYEKSVASIRRVAGAEVAGSPGGLYTGTAGMAVGVLEGIKVGLISSNAGLQHDVQQLLGNGNLDGFGISTGLAGRGLALLHAMDTIDDLKVNDLLNNTLDLLLRQQQRDGSWLSAYDGKRAVKSTNWFHGVSGISLFLLECLKKRSDLNTERAVSKSLDWLIKNLRYRRKDVGGGHFVGDPGVMLTLVRAYDVLGDRKYKGIVENYLLSDCDYHITDLTLAGGVAAIGELFLEAAKVFESEVFLSRANGVADFLLHYFVQQNDGSCYWLAKGNELPTADLLVGNCGVIHFLLRIFTTEQITHPLTIV